MLEKICLVTGANSGVGKMAAIGLASKGARLVLLCRNPKKAEIARKEIQQVTDNRNIEILECDLSSQVAIRQAAEKFKAAHTKLDVLLNNAGIYTDVYQESEEGIEMTMAVNHFGHFLLSNLLLPCLKAAENARVVNLSSEANRFAKFNPNQIVPNSSSFQGMRTYGLSKLANIMFTHELSKRWGPYGITANSCHPGFVDSNFFLNFNGPLKWLSILAKPFMVNETQGAETPLYLSTAKAVSNISGKYFVRRTVKKPHPDAYNNRLTGLLWQYSEKKTGLV